MKLKQLLIGMCVTAIGLGFTGCTQNSANIYSKGKWEVSKTLEISQPNYIGGFYDENYGVTVGYKGNVYYTKDGGDSWTHANNNSWCRFGLCIVNDKVAYNCGNRGHVRKTTDGGENWDAEVTDYGVGEPNQCRYLSFIDENTGWIAAPKQLAMTTDGGQSYTEIKLPDGIGNILSMDLYNESTGYLIDDNNNLYMTNDKGSTWTSTAINISNIDTEIKKTNGQYLRFMDENNAVLFYLDKDNHNVKCAYTSDAGKSWKDKEIPNVDASSGFYLSKDGKTLSANGINGMEMTILKLK